MSPGSVLLRFGTSVETGWQRRRLQVSLRSRRARDCPRRSGTAVIAEAAHAQSAKFAFSLGGWQKVPQQNGVDAIYSARRSLRDVDHHVSDERRVQHTPTIPIEPQPRT